MAMVDGQTISHSCQPFASAIDMEVDMKRIVIAVASALAIAPALAQWDGPYYGQDRYNAYNNNNSYPSWFPESDRIAYYSTRQGRRMMRAFNLQTGRDQLLFETDQDMGWPKRSRSR